MTAGALIEINCARASAACAARQSPEPRSRPLVGVSISVRLIITLLVYGLAQAVPFGAGLLAVLATPLRDHAAVLVPAAIVLSLALAIPIAWKVAPIMRSRHQRMMARRREHSA